MMMSGNRRESVVVLNAAGAILSETDHQAYIYLCTVVKRTIYPSKMDYYCNQIKPTGVDGKKLFCSVDHLITCTQKDRYSLFIRGTKFVSFKNT